MENHRGERYRRGADSPSSGLSTARAKTGRLAVPERAEIRRGHGVGCQAHPQT